MDTTILGKLDQIQYLAEEARHAEFRGGTIEYLIKLEFRTSDLLRDLVGVYDGDEE